MLKQNVTKIIGSCDGANNLTREQKFEVFCKVCDGLLKEGKITRAKHSAWTNIF